MGIAAFLLTALGVGAVKSRDAYVSHQADLTFEQCSKRLREIESKYINRDVQREMERLIIFRKEEEIYDLVGDNLEAIFGLNYREEFKAPFGIYGNYLADLLLSKKGYIRSTMLPSLPSDRNCPIVAFWREIEKNLQEAGTGIEFGYTNNAYTGYDLYIRGTVAYAGVFRKLW